MPKGPTTKPKLRVIRDTGRDIELIEPPSSDGFDGRTRIMRQRNGTWSAQWVQFGYHRAEHGHPTKQAARAAADRLQAAIADLGDVFEGPADTSITFRVPAKMARLLQQRGAGNLSHHIRLLLEDAMVRRAMNEWGALA